MTPKTSRYTRCSISMLPNVSISGRIRSSGQLGRWWYSINPCRNNDLVSILVAVGMFRANGAMEFLVGIISPLTAPLGMPAEALPVALVRPLSGTGAFGLAAATIQDPAIGPDSYIGYLATTLSGATDPTFYVLAVYFGAIQIRRARHALAAGLTADVAGAAGAVIACSYLHGAP